MSGKWNGIAALEIGAGGGGGGDLDLVTPATDHSGTGIITSSYTANETISFGQCLYLFSDVGTPRWSLADSDIDSRSGKVALAMALEAGVTDTAMEVLLVGLIRDDTWNWSTGQQLYVDDVAGALSTSPPTAAGSGMRPVGFAMSADVVYFNPPSFWAILE